MKKLTSILGVIVFTMAALISCENAKNKEKIIIKKDNPTIESELTIAIANSAWSYIDIDNNISTIIDFSNNNEFTISSFRGISGPSILNLKGNWNIENDYISTKYDNQNKYIKYTIDKDFSSITNNKGLKFRIVNSKKTIELNLEELKRKYQYTKTKNILDEEVFQKDVNIEYYKIEDVDGYSNLRELPGGQIIRKVYNDEKFEVIGEEKKHKKVKLNDTSTGYIHSSRVVNWNDKVCECLNSADLIVKKGLDNENARLSLARKFLEIFRYNLCPKGCDFLYDEDVIDFNKEIKRCINGGDSSKTSASGETPAGTKTCLVGYDWVYPSISNPSSAWKFSSDGTFSFSTNMFGGMSAWGNWLVTSSDKIQISYTKTTEGTIPGNQTLTMSSCNDLRVGSTNYLKD